jgi:hypothetical protein
MQMMFVPQRKQIHVISMAYYGDIFAILYGDDVRTSQETHLWPSTARYGEIFAMLYGDDVRTSKETNLWAPTACYGVSFTFLYVDYVCTSQETHFPPRPVTGTAFLKIRSDNIALRLCLSVLVAVAVVREDEGM